MSVSVLVCVFDKLELTRRCLELLLGQRSPLLREVIVVDNGSSDGTPEYLAELAASEPLLTVLSPGENLGFVGGNNLAAAHARGSYLLFLNNDTEPEPAFLEALVARAESDPAIGAVGAKLVYPDGRLQEAGGIVFSDASGWNYGRGGDPSDPRFGFVRDVDYCSGACLLVRTELFRGLGCFDERYAPAYYEDTDLCFAIRARGGRVVYEPRAVVVHHEGATAGTDLSGGFKRHQASNRTAFADKWADALTRQHPPSSAHVRRASDRAPGARILVVDPLMPVYDRASGSRRLHELLKLLAAAGNAVTFIARNGADGDRYRGELEALGIEVHAGDPDRLNPLGMGSTDRRVDLPALLAETRYELAILCFWYLVEQYAPIVRRFSPQTRILGDTVDVHYVRKERGAVLDDDATALAAARAERERELAAYRQADALIAVTDADRDALLGALPDATVHLIPNIHALGPAGAGFADREGLLFVGNFGHTPNVDAALFLCREVLPAVRRRLPDVTVTLVGPKPPPEVEALADDDGVVVTGHVADTAPYLDAHRLSVAPLRYGAGMKGKVGEALAAGLPVVTTSVGAEGMAEPGEEPPFAVADGADALADAIVSLYDDEPRWRELAARGRAHVESRYSPAAVGEALRTLVAGELEARAEPGLTSIVILVRDQRELTEACLASIEACTPEPHELILVDNGSGADTARFLRDYVGSHSSSRLVVNRDNRGFAAGNNLGLALARGDAVLFLNNDTVVTDGWLGRLRRALDAHPEAGLAGPVSNRVSGPQLVVDPAAYDADAHAGEWQPLERIVGFCLLARRAVIDRIGGLDERFGAGNFEDDDFCLRARLEGFAAGVARDAFVHHVGGATFAGAGIDHHQAMLANWALFKEKWRLPPDASAADEIAVDPDAVAGVLRHELLPAIGLDHEPVQGGRVWVESYTYRVLASGARALATGRRDLLRTAFAEAAAWADVNRRYQARRRLVELTLATPSRDPSTWRPAFAATAAELLSILEEEAREPLLLNYAGVLLYELGEPGAEALFAAARRLDPELADVERNLRAARKRRRGAGGRPRELTERALRVAAAARPAEGLTLSLCMIVKDEEELLPECLERAKNAVDEIILVDTGSTDRTIEIATSYGAKIIHHPWTGNFAEARNISLEHATSDWILYLDADEHLTHDAPHKLRTLLGKTWREAFYLVETNLTGGEGSGEAVAHLALRLWRNRPEYRFEGRIHEQKTSSMPHYLPERFEISDVQLTHYGYLASRVTAREKSRRNIALLEQEVAERGLTAFGAFNLGTEHVVAGNAATARDYLERGWELLQRQPGWASETYAPMLISRLASLRRTDGDLEGTRAIVAAGLGFYPDHTDLVLKLALCALDERDWPGVEEHANRCLELGDAPPLYSGTVGSGSYLPLALLAQACEAQGRADEAEAIYRRTLTEYPDFAAVALPLANAMLRRGATPAEIELALPPGRPRALLLAASACYEAGRTTVAAEWFARILATEPGNDAARVGLVEALLAERRYDEAVEHARARRADSPVEAKLALAELFVHALRGDGEALDATLAAAELPPSETALFTAWADLLADREPPDELPAETLAPTATLLEALLKVSEFDAFEALHRLYTRIAVDPATRSELLAALYFRRGFLDSAADEWIASYGVEPASGALLGLAHVAVAKGLPEDAVTLCDEALALDPENDDAHALRSAALERVAA